MPTKVKPVTSSVINPSQASCGSLEQILTQAENKNLTPKITSFESLSLLKETLHFYETVGPSQGKMIMLDRTSQSVHMRSDKDLLGHVLYQTIANAAEASSIDQAVELGCIAEHNQCTFWVRNEAVVSEFVRERIFDRRFSTKCKTRGLGAYSIKLLSEEYLKGKITLTSIPDQGTVWRATFPLFL